MKADRPGWNPRILRKSRISESLGADPADLKPFPLLEYQGETDEGLALRLTLKPLEGDPNTPGGGRPLFPFGVTGVSVPGLLSGPSVPGARGGWVRGGGNAGDPPINPISGTPFFALVKWGIGESRRSLLMADWPVGGASIELVASNVEVYGQIGAVTIFLPGAPQLPNFAAELGPSQGMGYNDEPLTFCQNIDLTGEPAVQVSVPEFARSVIVSVSDTFTAPADFLQIDFVNMTVGSLQGTRLDFVAGNRAPVELAVPGAAVMMILSGQGVGATSVVQLQWRIAP